MSSTNNKEKLYIINTQYQLLITLLKVQKGGLDTIAVVNKVLDKHIEDTLSRERIVKDIIYVNEEIFAINGSKIGRKNIKIMLQKFDEIYIFIDHFTLGAYINKYKMPYHVIEDGYNFFSYTYRDFRDKVFTRQATKQDYKELIKHLLICRKSKPGFGKYCQSIEVNDKSILSKDKRYLKYKEVPRKELFESMSKERKEMILRVFGVEKLETVKRRSTLILTQPLFIDGIMKNEDNQFNFYRKISDKYKSEGYEVYIKPHPRDNICYKNIQGIKLIDASVPIELIELVSKVEFEKIITHSSTSIDFLSCGKEKEIFYDFNSREYDNALLKKYNINKDEL